MLYPLVFAPVYKEIIWGGTKMRDIFHRDVPFDRVAESWELCCRDDGMSVAANGALRGKTLQSLLEERGEAILGRRVFAQYGTRFPLLVKLIDANDRLSVQVHPGDAYAKQQGEENGKNEVWYVVDAAPDAQLIYGLRPGTTKERFADAVRRDEVENTLQKIPVKPGDVLYIPAGTVHAILGGILIAEIQQNSNTTYRIYDWNRVDAKGNGRALHLQNALDVIDFSRKSDNSTRFTVEQGGAYRREARLRSPFFCIDELALHGAYASQTGGDAFTILLNIRGSGSLHYDGGSLPLARGDTVLLPACLGGYRVQGDGTLLLVTL